MEIEKLNTRRFYTIKGSGRADVYKITAVDKVDKKVYLAGVNCIDHGYIDIDRLRVFSDRSIAEYILYLKKILKEMENWSSKTKIKRSVLSERD
jgi:hypothetical protein